jgi:hypothetical protein
VGRGQGSSEALRQAAVGEEPTVVPTSERVARLRIAVRMIDRTLLLDIPTRFRQMTAYEAWMTS